MRRSTVLSPPLQLVFPALTFDDQLHRVEVTESDEQPSLVEKIVITVKSFKCF
jgi:hypothetical protein